MNEIELLEQKSLREELIGRTDILAKVKELVLLPYGDSMTTEMVADYYIVPKGTIDSLVSENNEEITSDGYTVLKSTDLKEFKGHLAKESDLKCIPSSLKYTSSLALFPVKAILRVAMLLTDSEIAKQVRSVLLKECPSLYYELSKENQLRFKKYEEEIFNYLVFSFGKEKVEKQISCGKYTLDFVIFNKIHIEVDEHGHRKYNKIQQKERDDYIFKNTEYYTIRYNPQIKKPYELIKCILNACEYLNYNI